MNFKEGDIIKASISSTLIGEVQKDTSKSDSEVVVKITESALVSYKVGSIHRLRKSVFTLIESVGFWKAGDCFGV